MRRAASDEEQKVEPEIAGFQVLARPGHQLSALALDLQPWDTVT
jgi:hypothetical protein